MKMLLFWVVCALLIQLCVCISLSPDPTESKPPLRLAPEKQRAIENEKTLSPNVAPSTPPKRILPQPSKDQFARCDMHPSCVKKGLKGLCCPALGGNMLDCCQGAVPPPHAGSEPDSPNPSRFALEDYVNLTTLTLAVGVAAMIGVLAKFFIRGHREGYQPVSNMDI